MDAHKTQPDMDWYVSISRKRDVTPRCPFASVERCPRYYHSLSLLGEAGFTKISKAEEARLETLWKTSDLLPRTNEGATSIDSSNGHVFLFCNFCPEVTYDGFGLFASLLAKYSDEIDTDCAHERLRRDAIPLENWRWRWASLTALHFTECPLYSPLTHDAAKASAAKERDTKTAEMLILKPGLWGINIDLKEFWRRSRSRYSRLRARLKI